MINFCSFSYTITATHGTGVEFGNLATMVTGLELVTGEGETLSLSETNHPIIFKAALVSVFINPISWYVVMPRCAQQRMRKRGIR